MGSGMVSDPSFPSDWSIIMRNYEKEMKQAELMMDTALAAIAIFLLALAVDMIRVCCF